ncbi:MAG: hypothetical protein IKU43_06225 [Clostridia bacterium]|nr:hypothetical protein [Clostridia bacterium]
MIKRLISASVAALLICSSCFCANAADYTAKEDGSYTVEIEGRTPGKEYVIVVVAGDYTEKEMPELSEDNIIYINQVTADENGVVSFSDFIPMTESVGTVYIGGDDTPTEAGILATDSGFGFVAGRLVSYSGNDETVVITEEFTSVDDGAFDKASETKKVIIRSKDVNLKANAFSKDMKLFFSPLVKDAKEYAVENGYSAAVIGDYDGDFTVDAKDVSYMLGSFAKGNTLTTDDWDIVFDIDSNGKVDLGDASILVRFLSGKIADFYEAYTEKDMVVNP